MEPKPCRICGSKPMCICLTSVPPKYRYTCKAGCDNSTPVFGNQEDAMFAWNLRQGFTKVEEMKGSKETNVKDWIFEFADKVLDRGDGSLSIDFYSWGVSISVYPITDEDKEGCE